MRAIYQALTWLAALALIYVGILIAGIPTRAATAPSHTENYCYDDLGRLLQSVNTAAASTPTQEQYVYDPADNRVTKTLSATAGGSNAFIVTPCGGTLIIREDPTGGGNSVTLTVSRAVTGTAQTVNVSSTGVASGDLTLSATTLNFAAGDVSKTVTVTAVNDTVHESTETFTVTFTGSGGSAIAAGSPVTIQIIDND